MNQKEKLALRERLKIGLGRAQEGILDWTGHLWIRRVFWIGLAAHGSGGYSGLNWLLMDEGVFWIGLAARGSGTGSMLNSPELGAGEAPADGAQNPDV